MGKKKQITIHKRNEMVRGSDRYSLEAKRALNAIYWGLQKYNLFNATYINIKFSTLRKVMNFENDNRYVEKLKNGLLELQQPMELNNFMHPIQKTKYDWYSLSFLDEAGFKKDEETGEWVATIKVNPIIKHLLQIEGNFTKLELLENLNKFRTKYAMKLYEYLKSFGAFKYIDITQKHIMKLLGIDENHNTYKHYAKLKTLIERQLKDIANKSDLKEVRLMNSKTLAKEKVFRIIINPKSKRGADKIIAKTALENLIKKF